VCVLLNDGGDITININYIFVINIDIIVGNIYN